MRFVLVHIFLRRYSSPLVATPIQKKTEALELPAGKSFRAAASLRIPS